MPRRIKYETEEEQRSARRAQNREASRRRYLRSRGGRAPRDGLTIQDYQDCQPIPPRTQLRKSDPDIKMSIKCDPDIKMSVKSDPDIVRMSIKCDPDIVKLEDVSGLVFEPTVGVPGPRPDIVKMEEDVQSLVLEPTVDVPATHVIHPSGPGDVDYSMGDNLLPSPPVDEGWPSDPPPFSSLEPIRGERARSAGRPRPNPEEGERNMLTTSSLVATSDGGARESSNEVPARGPRDFNGGFPALSAPQVPGAGEVAAAIEYFQANFNSELNDEEFMNCVDQLEVPMRALVWNRLNPARKKMFVDRWKKGGQERVQR